MSPTFKSTCAAHALATLIEASARQDRQATILMHSPGAAPAIAAHVLGDGDGCSRVVVFLGGWPAIAPLMMQGVVMEEASSMRRMRSRRQFLGLRNRLRLPHHRTGLGGIAFDVGLARPPLRGYARLHARGNRDPEHAPSAARGIRSNHGSRNVSVTINGPGEVTGQFDYHDKDGSVITFYGWTFSVTVDGQVGVYTVWVDGNDPSAEAAAAQGAIDDLEANPGDLEGIAENDPGQDMGDFGDEGDFGDFGDDDGGDTAVAGNEGGDDVGVSV